jgi:hypothetical protein
MPYSYTVDPTARIARVVGAGAADLQSTLAVMRTLAADEAFEPGFDVIVDARTLKYLPSRHEVQQAVAVLGALRARYRGRVGVVTSTGVMFGIVRMFGTLMESQGVHLAPFASPQAALSWILS